MNRNEQNQLACVSAMSSKNKNTNKQQMKGLVF